MSEADADASDSAAQNLRFLVAKTVTELTAMNAPDEALAIVTPPKRIGPFTKPMTMAPAGRAWRLGVLLIDRAGGLYATGEVTRAIEPKIAVTNRSAEAELRRDFRRAAAHGRFPEGEVINHAFERLAVDAASLAEGSGLLVLDGETVMLRWDAGRTRDLVLLEKYLADRVSLFDLD